MAASASWSATSCISWTPTGRTGDVVPAGLTLTIPNTAPDEGLSAGFNTWFTFFGQFFDHGLDFIQRTTEIVFIPLAAG